MAIIHSSLIVLLIFFLGYTQFIDAKIIDFEPKIVGSFNRSSFPEDFIFGTASAAYQYEGAAFEDGRGPSIWDNFTHQYPDRIAYQSNGDVAIDFYHRYKEDVLIMKNLGVDTFRFSISWSRILPNGKLSGGVNQKGIEFYNNLINDLLSKDIQPCVTVFHWDFPQQLEDEYGGFLSPLVVDDFQAFADLCFKEFGDRVKYWITINEPWTYSNHGYDQGVFAPGRCSKWINEACQAGNSSIEPYLVAHHLILSHAAAVAAYKTKYQTIQNGEIGISLNCHWMKPYSEENSDIAAAGRALEFMLGWFLEPLTYGKYPLSMHKRVGDRLPRFSAKQSMMVKRSYDFVGINYYTTFYAKNVPFPNPVNISYSTDSLAYLTTVDSEGVRIGYLAGSDWLHVYPKGIREVLIYVKDSYMNPKIFITENGVDEVNNSTFPVKRALKDFSRVVYHTMHLVNVQEAIEDGVNVKGYFAWSLLDNFEWSDGYSVRFGLTYVDYNDNLKRYLKDSAIWFKHFLT